MAKSALLVKCINASTEWQFPYEIDTAKIGTVAVLTLGVVKEKRVTTVTKYTDTITDPEGTFDTGTAQRKAVCVFKHTPATGDARLHRISIPAPDIGDTGIYATTDDNGGVIPMVKTGTSPGKDGSELATLFKAAMNLEGTFEFLSGVVVTGRTHS